MGQNERPLEGKHGLITGAGSGIGRAVAKKLSEAGANVALAARTEEDLKEVAASLDPQSSSLVIPTDVRDAQQVQHAVEQTVASFGSLDILVNNAGFGIFKPITDLEVEEFDSMIEVNLRGLFLCTKYALQQMYRQKGGDVVTISSLAGKNGFATGGGYCASKFGVMGLMESLFHEARKENVRIITLTPGSVNTDFFDNSGKNPPDREKILQPEDVAETLLHTLLLPRRALIREVDIRPANPA